MKYKCNSCGAIRDLDAWAKSMGYSPGARIAGSFICERCGSSDLSPLSERELGESDSGCFIATAAFDSPDHPTVRILRNWKENHLDSNYFGRIFIKFYYAISPNLAQLIKSSIQLQKGLRIILNFFARNIDKGRMS